MKHYLYKLIIVFLIVLLLPFDSFNHILAEEAGSNGNKDIVNILSDEFNVSSDEIMDLVNEGLSLVDIKSALILAGSTGEDYKNFIERARPTGINNSSTTESEVKSDLSEDYKFATFSSIENPPSTIDPASKLSLITNRTSEAPYLVNLNNESVSTISGSLSYFDDDAYLPGRGGLSFDLRRTYNSQSSQFDDMKIGVLPTSSIYYVEFYLTKKTYKNNYKATTNMRKYDEIDEGCNGTVDYSSASLTTGSAVESGWLPSSSDASSYLFSPNYGSWSECKSGPGVDPNSEIPSTQSLARPCKGICENGVMDLSVNPGRRTRVSYYPDRPNHILTNSNIISTTNTSAVYDSIYDTYGEALEQMNEIISKQGKIYLTSAAKVEGSYTIYDEYVYTGQAVIQSIPIDIEYKNEISQPINQKKFPIGTGWSWNIPFVETKAVNGVSKQFIHMDDGSVSEIENNKLKGNIWNDYTFNDDSTINTSEFKSKYVLKEINGINKYFDDQGQLILITNSYGNEIKFYYQKNSIYGSVLSSIEDDIGNSINITYTNDEVKITNGTKQVKYKKIIANGKELLSQVVSPSNLITTYSYDIKQAQFNLLGATPISTNPYALLTKITHPTGAETIYEYQDAPVNRLLSPDTVNQSYKLKKRYDMYKLTNGPSINQLREYYFDGDPGKKVKNDDSLKTTIRTGTTSIDYYIKKKFYDDTIGDAFYISEIDENGVNTSKITLNTYDETKRNPYPILVENKNIVTENGVTSFSPTVSSTRQYNDYGLVSYDKENQLSNTYDYSLQNVLLQSGSTNKQFSVVLPSKITSVQEKSLNGTDETVITNYDYGKDTSGNVTKKVETKTENNKVIGKTETQYNSEGNASKLIQYKSYQSDTVNEKVTHDVIYSTESNLAFPSEYRVEVTNVDGIKCTIIKKFEYNSLTGNLTKSIDGNNNETDYQYDLEDRVNKVVYKDPTKTTDSSPSVQFSYNDLLNEIVTTNELGEKTKEKWNPLGWQTGTYKEYNQIYRSEEQLEYDQYGRQIRSIDAKGNLTTTSYDEWNRPLFVYEADYVATTETGGKTSYRYNDLTFENQTTDNENNSIIEDFDEYGKLQAKKDTWKDTSGVVQSKITEKYTYVGDDYTLEDSLGNQTAYEYDWSNQLTSVKILPNQSQTNSETTKYNYDLLGNLVNMTTANNQVTRKTFDELGRIIKIIKPSGKQEKSYYDKNSNLLKKIDAINNTTTYKYNFRNLVSKRQITTDQAQQDTLLYQYDISGKVTARTDSTGTTSYQYYLSTDTEPDKSIGSLKKMTLPDGSNYQYYYTLTGNRKAIDLKIAGNPTWRIDYSYDSQERLQSVSSPNEQITQTYSYTKNNQIQKASILNHSEMTTTYDNTLKAKINDNLLSNGNSINSYEFKYDANENIVSLKTNGKLDTFQYDSQNRIVYSTINNQMYSYDPMGNREMELSEDDIDQGTMDYEYTALNELKKVTKGNQTVDYIYNGDGLLYERKEGGITTRYYYDGLDVIAEATINNGVQTLKARYLRGNQGLIARISEEAAEKASYGGVAYYHFNGHGDVVSLLDKQGNVLNKYSYDVWGNPIQDETSETIKNPFQYSGEYWDKTMNIQYLRARWYDPSEGRFITEDSYEGDISDPLSLNRYTYVGNNPLTYWDPSGHIPSFEQGTGESYQYSVDEMFRIIDSKEHPLTWRDKAKIWDYMTFSKLTPEDIADGFLLMGPIGENGKKGSKSKSIKKKNGAKKKTKQSGKEKSTDVAEWVKYETPFPGETAQEFATRILNDKYRGNWKKGGGTEYNEIIKYAHRTLKLK